MSDNKFDFIALFDHGAQMLSFDNVYRVMLLRNKLQCSKQAQAFFSANPELVLKIIWIKKTAIATATLQGLCTSEELEKHIMASHTEFFKDFIGLCYMNQRRPNNVTIINNSLLLL